MSFTVCLAPANTVAYPNGGGHLWVYLQWALGLAAACLAEHYEEYRQLMEPRGWRLREAWDVSSTPEQYGSYVQQSRGEFSCAKPAYVTLETAWVSDRTICYLASGRPAVVQHTGRSGFLPDADGLFRFRNLEEAAAALAAAEADYERHCRQARALAEEHFNARRVVGQVLERAFERPVKCAT
jgi:glycosyltransferase involved in cell wall biosynthesis